MCIGKVFFSRGKSFEKRPPGSLRGPEVRKKLNCQTKALSDKAKTLD